MKNPARLLLCCALCIPTLSSACEPTAAQAEDYWQRSRKNEEAHVGRLARTADQIFTGTIVHVTDLPDGPHAQLAHISVEAVLKGHPGDVTSARMHLRVNPARDNPSLDQIRSCDEARDPTRDEPYVVKTYRYLYYVKDGVLLRANAFPIGAPPLQPEAEMELLRQAGL